MKKAKESPISSGLSRLISGLDEQFRTGDDKKPVVTTVGEMYRNQRYIDLIDTKNGRPAFALQWMLGARGFPAGRITQLRAKYSSGKSSFLYHIYACALYGQKADDQKAWVAHIETEGAPNPPDYIARFGLDPDAFMFLPVKSMDDCFRKIDTFLVTLRGGFGGSVSEDTGRQRKTVFTNPIDPENKYPAVLGVDSFSNLGDEDEVNNDVIDISKSERVGGSSKAVRRFMRERTQRYYDADMTLFVTSAETASIATGPAARFAGNQKTARNQEALGIALTFGIDTKDRKWFEDGKNLGSVQTLFMFKNKLSPRYREVELFRNSLGGYDMARTDLNFFMKHPASPFAPGNFLNPKGEKALYNAAGTIHCPLLSEKGFKSADEFMAALAANTDLVDAIREGLRIRGLGFDFDTKYRISDEQMNSPDYEGPEPDKNGRLAPTATPDENPPEAPEAPADEPENKE